MGMGGFTGFGVWWAKALERLKSFLSRRAWLLSLIVFCLNWWVWSFHLELGADEAHYWLYGRYLSGGYVDHPPFVGWWQGWIQKGLTLFYEKTIYPLFHSSFSLPSHWELWIWRWPPVLGPIARIGAFLTSLVLAGLFYRSTSSSESWWAWVTTPLPWAMSLFWLPDTPLALWAWLWCYWHGDQWQKISPFLWATLNGVWLGLMALTKFTSIIVVLPLVWGLWKGPSWWWQRYSRWAWWMVLVVCGLLYPFIDFNLHHDWVSFRFQWNNVMNAAKTLTSRPILNVAIAGLSQWIAYGLFIVPGLIVGLKNLPLRKPWQSRDLFGWSGLTVLIFFALKSPSRAILLHWTYVGWWLLWFWQHERLPRVLWRYQLYFNLIVLAPLTVLLLGRFPWIDRWGLNFAEVRGWPQVWQEILKITQLSTIASTAGEKQPPFVLLTPRWWHGSRLMVYAPALFRDFVGINDSRQDQYHLWQSGWQERWPRKALMVVFEPDWNTTLELSYPCLPNHQIHEARAPNSPRAVHRFQLWWCEIPRHSSN